MLAWLSPLIVLGLVVFVHELGHFLAAKAVGVYAPRFSLGWGTPLLRWRPKGTETEYVLSALPIGGYVRMASRDDEASAILEGGNETLKEGAEHDKHWDPEAMVPNGPKPVPQDRWFESKATWQRVVILIAGVFMNVVLTLVVSTGIYMSAGRRYVPAVIDSVVAGKPAAAAGLQRGDSVLSINGAAVRTWSDVISAISASPEKPLFMDIARAGATITLTMTPDAQTVPGGPTGKPERVGRVGVGPQNKEGAAPMPPGECVVAAWHATRAMAGWFVGGPGGAFSVLPARERPRRADFDRPRVGEGGQGWARANVHPDRLFECKFGGAEPAADPHFGRRSDSDDRRGGGARETVQRPWPGVVYARRTGPDWAALRDRHVQ